MLQAKSEITGKTNIVLIVHFPIQTFVQMQLFFCISHTHSPLKTDFYMYIFKIC